MRSLDLRALRCPIDLSELRVERGEEWWGDDLIEGKLVCAEGHGWDVSEGLPSLVDIGEVSEADLRWMREYDEDAEDYDERIKVYDLFLRTDMAKERERLMAEVPLQEGARILDVSIGTAANFMAMEKASPDQVRKAVLHGVDLSRGMLRVARGKLKAVGIDAVLAHTDPNRRHPFPDGYFDAVIHTGGVNTFSDIPHAFSEMLRICKSGGLILVSDEGLSPTQEKTEFGQWVISQNRLFKSKPPLNKVPKNVGQLRCWWIVNDTFYAIAFRKP